MPISDRYQRLLARRAPSLDRLMENFAETYERQIGETTKYILGAMKQVDHKYTMKLIEQGDRVENQLSTRLNADYPRLAFRRQGSVSNNTHIRFFSDVDVLVIIDKYVALEPPQQASNPYAGDPIKDLSTLRTDCFRELANAFPKVTVDNSGSTSVKMCGGSLACPVDIVPSNWFDTVAYSTSRAEQDRGIQVFNKVEGKRIKNLPFLFNCRIDAFDRNCAGVLRMLIRLLKTVKADCEEEKRAVEFSSFDICSLVYRMPTQYFSSPVTVPLAVLHNLLVWMRSTIVDEGIRGTIKVVDDSRLIYDEPSKMAGATTLYNETSAIYKEALEETRGQTLVTEAHIK